MSRKGDFQPHCYLYHSAAGLSGGRKYLRKSAELCDPQAPHKTRCYLVFRAPTLLVFFTAVLFPGGGRLTCCFEVLKSVVTEGLCAESGAFTNHIFTLFRETLALFTQRLRNGTASRDPSLCLPLFIYTDPNRNWAGSLQNKRRLRLDGTVTSSVTFLETTK